MLELTWRGQNPLKLADGETRKWLEELPAPWADPLTPMALGVLRSITHRQHLRAMLFLMIRPSVRFASPDSRCDCLSRERRATAEGAATGRASRFETPRLRSQLPRRQE